MKTDVYLSDGERDDQERVPCEYFVAECETCHELLLYHSFAGDVAPTEFHRGDLLYPKSVELHSSVPKSVRSCYIEAATIKNNAPNAYAVMIRRALETLCDDRGVEKGTLQHRLETLSQKGEIPPTLTDMTSVLRLLGNAGAHSSHIVTVPMT